jgi:hypothetical protein
MSGEINVITFSTGLGKRVWMFGFCGKEHAKENNTTNKKEKNIFNFDILASFVSTRYHY